MQRRNTAWVAEMERSALVWLAGRLPAAVTPNALTAIGMLGALIVVLGYLLAAGWPAMLWLASVGFVLNWFGDSLDGTVARVRLARPLAIAARSRPSRTSTSTPATSAMSAAASSTFSAAA